MPTYEYLCQTCSHRFETWQKMTDEPLTVCPECGNHIRRVLYPAGVVFKGSGFYKTDHAEKKAAAAPSGESKSSETKSGEGASESKTSTETKSSESGSSKSDGASTSSTAPSTATK